MGLRPIRRSTTSSSTRCSSAPAPTRRIEDLRAAAGVVKGKKVAANIKLALVVPGSGLVKRQAEAEGLDKIFIEAGFEWREPGCSMCLAMNADRLSPGERCASTSNRNFEGRQGAGRAHPPGQPGDGRCGCHRRPLRRYSQPNTKGSEQKQMIRCGSGDSTCVLQDRAWHLQDPPARPLGDRNGAAKQMHAESSPCSTGWCAARPRQRRYRRDHPQAVSQVDQAFRLRPLPVRRMALYSTTASRAWTAATRPLNKDFVLNQPRYQGAQVLLARDNFGCGSSREHAPWAMEDYGFRVIIAPSLRRHLLRQLLQERHPADRACPPRSWISCSTNVRRAKAIA